MMTFVGRNAAAGQVMSSLVEIVKSQLGTCKSIKCVMDGDEKHFDLFSCTAFLLQNLDIEHPVYNVINGVVQSHHSSHGNCSKTLLMMAGLWYLKLEELVSQGFDVFKIVKTFEAGLEASITHLMHSSAIRYLDNFPSSSGNQEIQRESTLLSGCGDNNPQSSLKDDLSQPNPREGVSAVNSTDAECFFRDDDVSWFFDSDLRVNNETVLTKTTSNTLSSEAFNLEESYRKMAHQEISSGCDGHLGRGEEGLCTEDIRADSVNDEDFEDCFSGTPFVSASQRNHPCSSSLESSLNHDPLTIDDCKLLPCTRDFGSRISCLQKDVARISFAESCARDHGCSLASCSLCSVESRARRDSGSGTKACHLMGCDGLLEPGGLEEDIVGIDWHAVSFGGVIEDMTEFEDDDVAAGSRLSSGVIDSGYTAADDAPPNRYSRHLAISSGDRNAKCPDPPSAQQSSERAFARLFSPVQTFSSFSDEENTGVQRGIHSPLIHLSNSSMSLSQWLMELGSRLSHGADDMMKLVVEMAHGQLIGGTSDRSRFDVVLIQTRCLGGVEEKRTCVVEGLLLSVDSDQVSFVVGEENAAERRALLVNGDLTSSYHHQGFRNDAKVTTVQKNLFAVESKYDTWLNGAISVIKQMNVGILFVRGSVDENLLYNCRCRKVVVFSGIPYSCLSALSRATNAPMNSYIVDCAESSSVATGIELRLWNNGWTKHLKPNKEQHYVTVQVRSSKVPLQTAIVCHPVESVAEVREEQVWHCAHRMQRVLAQRKALVGSGHAERTCAAFLDGSAENLMKYSSNQEDCETAAIYWAMGECFTRFSDIVSKNSAKRTTEDPNVGAQEDIYDDCGSKLDAWRSASFLVGLLLRCDMEIVTQEAKAITSSQGLTVGFFVDNDD